MLRLRMMISFHRLSISNYETHFGWHKQGTETLAKVIDILRIKHHLHSYSHIPAVKNTIFFYINNPTKTDIHRYLITSITC